MLIPSFPWIQSATKHLKTTVLSLLPNSTFRRHDFPMDISTSMSLEKSLKCTEALRTSWRVTAYHFKFCHPDLWKTRLKTKQPMEKLSLWTMQEQIAIKSGYQVSMHDRWWIHLTWDNFSNKFIWSKINYCQETLWKFHLKRVKKGN